MAISSTRQSVAKKPITVPPEYIPDVSNLITEDDTPVDNFFSEKRQRLLVEPLYASWKPLDTATQEPRPFLVSADVGIYYALREPALVPDVFLSLDVTVPDDWWEKNNRCYMMWEFGKEPEVVIEIVSNLKGGELSGKLELYAHRLHSRYYVVFDPSGQYGDDILRIFYNNAVGYERVETLKGNNSTSFPLNLALWHGSYEGSTTWLRWYDESGVLIPTGRERAEQERERATKAETQLQELTLKLRAMGLDPDTL